MTGAGLTAGYLLFLSRRSVLSDWEPKYATRAVTNIKSGKTKKLKKSQCTLFQPEFV